MSYDLTQGEFRPTPSFVRSVANLSLSDWKNVVMYLGRCYTLVNLVFLVAQFSAGHERQ